MRTALFVLILALAGCGTKPEEAAKPVVPVEVERVDKTTVPLVVRAAVTAQNVYAGDMAKPDAVMFTVMDLSVVVARAQTAEQEAGVRLGQRCEFEGTRLEPYPTGRITVVSKAVDAARRTVAVWCEIPNGKRELRGNVFGNIAIYTGDIPDGLVAPLAAVQFEEGTSKGSTFVVDEKKALSENS